MVRKLYTEEEPFNTIATLLRSYEHVILEDYEKYYNHVCRVVGNCLLFDTRLHNQEKYILAGIFHDIGIWTNHTIDYLAPSEAAAKSYLEASGNAALIPEIIQMISWHHKTTAYKGEFADTVNNFRKADWIDVSLGVLSFGANRKSIAMNRQRFPNRGFHFFLVRKLAKNFLKHPLSPLPMFRL